MTKKCVVSRTIEWCVYYDLPGMQCMTYLGCNVWQPTIFVIHCIVLGFTINVKMHEAPSDQCSNSSVNRKTFYCHLTYYKYATDYSSAYFSPFVICTYWSNELHLFRYSPPSSIYRYFSGIGMSLCFIKNTIVFSNSFDIL